MAVKFSPPILGLRTIFNNKTYTEKYFFFFLDYSVRPHKTIYLVKAALENIAQCCLYKQVILLLLHYTKNQKTAHPSKLKRTADRIQFRKKGEILIGTRFSFVCFTIYISPPF